MTKNHLFFGVKITLLERFVDNSSAGQIILYVEHDRGRLDKSAEAFFQVFSTLFPEISPVRSWRAAEIYVQVCVKQDEIENYPGHGSTQILEDPRWETDVKGLLTEFSRTLYVPESYADSTMNYFRFH